MVYVDESGDHSLTSINPDYPMFVLAFSIFPIDLYVDRIVPLVQRLKFDFFNHDMVVLHEREIRQSKPPFDILLNAETRAAFMSRIDQLFEERFGVVATAIRKTEFRVASGGHSPYHVALEYGLERVFLQLSSSARGRVRDRDAPSSHPARMPETFRFCIAHKQANSTGLQLADLVARPIGTHLLHPDRTNRAWERILQRMPKSPAAPSLGGD